MADSMPLSDQALEAEFLLWFAANTGLTARPAIHTINTAVAWGRHLLEQQSAKPLG